jgi:acylphosphatase
MPTVHLIIRGEVQGVFYRATTKDVADKAGIKGWVKNTADGNVEIMATGTEEQLTQFIEWCKKGPRKAKVEDVKQIRKLEERFEEFVILR